MNIFALKRFLYTFDPYYIVFLPICLGFASCWRLSGGVYVQGDMDYPFYPATALERVSSAWSENQDGYSYILPTLGNTLFSVFVLATQALNIPDAVTSCGLLGGSVALVGYGSGRYYRGLREAAGLRPWTLGEIVVIAVTVGNLSTGIFVSFGGVRELLSFGSALLAAVYCWEASTRPSKVKIFKAALFALLSSVVLPYWVVSNFLICVIAVQPTWPEPPSMSSVWKHLYPAFTSIFVNSVSVAWIVIPFILSVSHGTQSVNLPLGGFEWFTLKKYASLNFGVIPWFDNQVFYGATIFINFLPWVGVLYLYCKPFPLHRGLRYTMLLSVSMLGLIALYGDGGWMSQLFRELIGQVTVLRMFRNPLKIGVFAILLISICWAETSEHLFGKWSFRWKATLGFVFVLFRTIASWPLLTGDLGGTLLAAYPPTSFHNVVQYANGLENGARIIIVPMPEWFNRYTWVAGSGWLSSPLLRAMRHPTIFADTHGQDLTQASKDWWVQLCDPAAAENVVRLTRLLHTTHVIVDRSQTLKWLQSSCSSDMSGGADWDKLTRSILSLAEHNGPTATIDFGNEYSLIQVAQTSGDSPRRLSNTSADKLMGESLLVTQAQLDDPTIARRRDQGWWVSGPYKFQRIEDVTTWALVQSVFTGRTVSAHVGSEATADGNSWLIMMYPLQLIVVASGAASIICVGVLAEVLPRRSSSYPKHRHRALVSRG